MIIDCCFYKNKKVYNIYLSNADVENCGEVRGFGYIYIYIYIDYTQRACVHVNECMCVYARASIYV